MGKGHVLQIDVVTTNTGTGFTSTSRFYNAEEERFIFSKRRLKMKHDDYHLIEFILDDQANLGLRFPDKPEDAMWVARASANQKVCPGPNDKDYSVLRPYAVVGGTKLCVHNPNMQIEDWAFTLNFLNTAGVSVPWDPIGGNQDGGVKLDASEVLAAAGVVLGVIGLTAAGFMWLNNS
jgi:hypothetical protein